MKSINLAQVMGTVVEVTRILVRQAGTDGVVTWEAWDTKPRAGWIVGFRFVKEGTQIRGSRSYEDSDQGYLRVSMTIPVVLISYWPTMKPVFSPLSFLRKGWDIGFRTPAAGQKPMSPSAWEMQHMSDANRKWYTDFMRADMKSWPRDKSGRWVKKDA